MTYASSGSRTGSSRWRMASSMRARAAGLAPAGQQNDAGSDDKHGAEQGERVAVTHDERLALDRLAESDDGLTVRGGQIADAAGREIFGHDVEPLAHGFAVHVDRRADDVRVELLAFGHERRVCGCPEV